MSKLSYRFEKPAAEGPSWYQGRTPGSAGVSVSVAARQASAQARRGEPLKDPSATWTCRACQMADPAAVPDVLPGPRPPGRHRGRVPGLRAARGRVRPAPVLGDAPPAAHGTDHQNLARDDPRGTTAGGNKARPAGWRRAGEPVSAAPEATVRDAARNSRVASQDSRAPGSPAGPR